MGLDTALQKVAKGLTKKFGKSITLRRVTNGAYNTTTRVSTPTTSDESIKAVVVAYTKNEVRGTVQAGDIKVLVAATDAGLTAAPTLVCTVLIDSVLYSIVSITPIYAQGLVVTHELQVRR